MRGFVSSSPDPGTSIYLWFQFNGIIKDSLSGLLSAVLVVFAFGGVCVWGGGGDPGSRDPFANVFKTVQDVLI